MTASLISNPKATHSFPRMLRRSVRETRRKKKEQEPRHLSSIGLNKQVIKTTSSTTHSCVPYLPSRVMEPLFRFRSAPEDTPSAPKYRYLMSQLHTPAFFRNISFLANCCSCIWTQTSSIIFRALLLILSLGRSCWKHGNYLGTYMWSEDENVSENSASHRLFLPNWEIQYS